MINLILLTLINPIRAMYGQTILYKYTNFNILKIYYNNIYFLETESVY